MSKRPEERLGCVVGIRVPQKVKEMLIKEAAVKKKSLSDYLFDLISAGREVMQAKAREVEPVSVEDLNDLSSRAAEAKEIPIVEGERSEESRTAERAVEAQHQPEEAEPPPAAGELPVDEGFLQGLREKYPALDFQKQMARVDQWAKRNPEKKISRGLLNGVFEAANRMRFS